ncbi:MAG: zinc ribbon domain-containing protein [Candidatus Thiodiazotropha sp. (ex Monitilora ramsayi)]|nr:zinc ribbon domain-containing protein [Candidatus Thiodiazotropha sp. (ex Monitilora ramsayi)]
MGWVRDTFQEYRIGRVKSVTGETQVRSHSNSSDIVYVEEKLDNLILITHAIWELLEENGISENQLEKKIKEIDLRDGIKDGKSSSTITSCPECGKKIKSRRSNCFWCGAKIPLDNLLSKSNSTE